MLWLLENKKISKITPSSSKNLSYILHRHGSRNSATPAPPSQKTPNKSISWNKFLFILCDVDNRRCMIEVNLETTFLSNAPMPVTSASFQITPSSRMPTHLEWIWEEGILLHVQYYCTLGTHLIVLKMDMSHFPEECYVNPYNSIIFFLLDNLDHFVMVFAFSSYLHLLPSDRIA